MKFKIKNPIKSKYVDCFVVVVDIMYGDADGYDKLTVHGFKKDNDESLLIDLIETLERMGKAYPRGRGGSDDYNHVEGFNSWFAVECLSEEEYESLSEIQKSFSEDWKCAPGGYGIQGSYKGYNIYYYDMFGNKYNVDIIK